MTNRTNRTNNRTNSAGFLEPLQIQAYLKRLKKEGASPATLKRKEAALKKFQSWQGKEYGPKYPLPKGAPKPKKIISKKGIFPKAFPPFLRYFSFLIGLVLLASLGWGVYSQFFAQPKETPSMAFPTNPPLLISFQGQLTDDDGTPINATIPAIFRLYNVDEGGTALWEEQKNVSTDQDGIFNTFLGDTATLDPAIFRDNMNLWLAIEIDNDGEMEPRQQIATVGYAFNSRYLQGYEATTAATANTIPVINADGDLILASSSPAIEATSGTFGLKGEAITIQSTGGTGGGDILIQPDADTQGQVIIYSATTADNSFTVQNSNITTGSLIYGEAGTSASGYNLLKLTSGSLLTDKFVVDYAGNTDIAGNLTVDSSGFFAGNVGVGTTSPSAPLSVGSSSQFQVDSSGDIVKLKNLTYSWPTAHTANGFLKNNGSGGLSWSTDITATSLKWNALTNPDDNLSLSHQAYTTTFAWGASTGTNNLFTLTDTANNTGTGYLLNLNTATGSSLKPLRVASAGVEALAIDATGNVGIGTTSPGAQLQISATSSSTLGQIIRLAPSHSVDALQIQDSSGTILSRFDKSGSLGIGIAPSDTMALRIWQSEIDPTSIVYGLHYDTNVRATEDGTYYGYAGFGRGDITVDEGVTANGRFLISDYTVSKSGLGSMVGPIYGFRQYSRINEGHASNMTGIFLGDVFNGGSVGTQTGLRIDLSSIPATTKYGIFITDVDVGATNYAIYTNTGPVSLGDNLIVRTGNVGIGKNNPTYKLDINGSVNATGYCLSGDCVNDWSEVGGSTYTASNGITLVGTDFQLGGTLDKLTTIDLNSNNFSFYGNGDVGIGTTSPLATLDVAGNLRIGTVNLLADNEKVLTIDDNGILNYIDTSSWDKDSTDDYSYWILKDSEIDIGQNIHSGTAAIFSAGTGIITTRTNNQIDFAVDTTYNFIWTGTHTFNNGTYWNLGDTTANGVWNTSGNVGIGTTAPQSKLEINGQSAVIGDELITNGTFTGGTAGWTLGDDARYGDNNVVVTYTGGDATLSTSFETTASKTYLLTFTISNANAAAYFWLNYSSHYSGPFFNGTHKIAFKTDFTGTETIYFEDWNYEEGDTWTIDNVSIKEIEPPSPALKVIGYNGATFLSLGGDLLANTALGESALYSNTTGFDNSALGSWALASNTTGDSNSALGSWALYSNTTGNSNSALGYIALYSNTTGFDNSALGSGALYSNTTGNSNSALGSWTLYSNTTGSRNSALGSWALASNTTGSYNSALGSWTLYSNTTGRYNSALGYGALASNTTGSYNSALGYEAGRYIADHSTANQTSNTSLYLGAFTKALANGDVNEIVIGYDAIGAGSNSVVLGNDEITKTILKGNVGIGTTSPLSKLHLAGSDVEIRLTDTGDLTWSLAALGTGSSRRFSLKDVDNNSELFTVMQNGNVGIGTTAPQSKLEINGQSAVIGDELITNGTFTGGTAGWTLGDDARYGDNNVVVTYTGGDATLSTSFETTASKTYLLTFTISNANAAAYFWLNYSSHYFGPFFNGTHKIAFKTDFTGTETIYFEDWNYEEGDTWTIDDVSIKEIEPPSPALKVIGYNGATLLSLGGDLLANTALGESALYSNTTGFANSALGSWALASNTTGDSNSALGSWALYSNTTGYSNSALGSWALYFNTTGFDNSALGSWALASNTTGYRNSALGSWALYSNTTGYSNSALGSWALYSNTTGDYNSALGSWALYSNTTGDYNSALGSGALASNTTGSRNSALGYDALYSNTTGDYNSALGSRALAFNTTGSRNSALGYNAGGYIADGLRANQTSNTSLYLGAFTKALANGDVNEIVIGYDAIGAGSNSVVLGNDEITKTILKGNVGIGTTSPLSKLHLAGSDVEIRLTDTGDLTWSLAALGTGGSRRFSIRDVDGNKELFTVMQTGNVGIGTTSPQAKLDINGNLRISALETGATDTVLTHSNNIVQQRTIDSRVWGSALVDYSGTTANYIPKMLDADTITNSIIYEAANGRIGISTTSPGSKLTVAGGASYFDALPAPTGVTANPTSGGGLVAGTYYYVVNAFDSNGLSSNKSSQVSCTVDGSTTTACQISWVAVPGAVNYRVFGRSSNSQNQYWQTTSTYYTDTGAAGTSGTPPSPISAFFTGNIKAERFADSANDTYYLDPAYATLSLTTAGAAGIGYSAGQMSGATAKLAVDGNVGIGTTGPNYKLDVNGDTRITGGLNIGSATGAETGEVQGRGNATVLDWQLESTNASTQAITLIGVKNDAGSSIHFGKLGSNDTYHSGYGSAGNSFIYTGSFGGPFNIIVPDSTNGKLNFYVGTNASSPAKMVITKDGNVGIGTTSPGDRLEVAGKARLTYSNPYLELTSTGTVEGGIRWYKNGGTQIGQVTMTDSYTTFDVPQNAYFRIRGFGGYWPVYFYINTSDGNVGIGTTAPIHKLDVNGSIHFNNNALIASDLGSSNIDHIWHDDASAGGAGGTWHFSSDTSYQAAGNARIQAAHAWMTANQANYFAGNVGIGTTSPITGSKLHIDGEQGFQSGNNFAGILNLYNTQTGSSGDEIGPYISFSGRRGGIDDVRVPYGAIGGINTEASGSSGGALVFLTKNAVGAAQTLTEQMRITVGGNVGIGTTGPNNALHVYRTGFSPSTNDLAALRIEGNWGGGIVFSEGTGRSSIWSGSGVDLRFGTGGTSAGISERMIINSSGNVGIGTTRPVAKLNVVGGAIYVQGNESHFYTTSFTDPHPGTYHSIKVGDYGIGVTGNSYFTANVSAASFTDRTPYPKDLATAYEALYSMERLPDGEYDEFNKEQQLDHSKLSDFIKGTDGGRDLSAAVSAHNEVIKNIDYRLTNIENPDIDINDLTVTDDYTTLAATTDDASELTALASAISVINQTTGVAIDKISTAADVIFGRVKAGFIETTALVAQKVVVEDKIISPLVETEQLNLKTQNAKVKTTTQNAKVTIVNSQDEPTAQFDTETKDTTLFGDLEVAGNVGIGQEVSAPKASFGDLLAQNVGIGQLEAESVKTEKLDVAQDATISGTLYVDRVVAREGGFGELLAENISIESIKSIVKEEVGILNPNQDGQASQDDGGGAVQDDDVLSSHSDESQNLNSEEPSREEFDLQALLTKVEEWAGTSVGNDLPLECAGGAEDQILNQVQDDGGGAVQNDGTSHSGLYPESKNLCLVDTNFTVLGGRTSLADTAIAGQLSVGSLVINNNSLDVLGDTLYLQKLAMGGLDILNGKLTVDINGNVFIAAHLTVGGGLATNEIRPMEGGDLTFNLDNTGLNGMEDKVSTQEETGLDNAGLNGMEDKVSTQEENNAGFGKLLVKGINNETVASIDASGSAEFKKVSTDLLEINTTKEASQSGEVIIAAAENFENIGILAPGLQTNATAGEATLPAGEKEIIIYNNKLTDQSLVYLTPTADTENKILYVKEKVGNTNQEHESNELDTKLTNENELNERNTNGTNGGYFVVGLNEALDWPVKFNWWIIN